MTELNRDIQSWLSDFLRNRNITSYKVDVAEKTTKGDGYLGEVMFVKVRSDDGDDGVQIYDLVIKSAKTSEELRKQTPIEAVYHREMYMYCTVLPEFVRFQKERAVDHVFCNYPSCYGVYKESGKEAIILENLRIRKYVVHDRRQPQNLHHVLAVFKNYANYHAVSLAMKHQRPKMFAELGSSMTDLLSEFAIQANMVAGIYRDFDAVRELLRQEDPESFRKLQRIQENDLQDALCKIADPPDELCVILHGDCWNNNMMFQYKVGNKSKPTAMAFLDFQLASVGSPIYDLSYYLYSVASDQVLDYFDVLLEYYHWHLVGFLRELGESSPDITLRDLKRHWSLYGSFGMAMAPFIIKVELSDDNVGDLVESAESGNLADTFNYELQDMDEYYRRVKSVIRHYSTFLAD
ncbi:uncharacterized protein LOC143201572 [Rhynchophorus ferrugineus]|uniref:CHK kinase-like domain-containing protein n=1 Tax=Rhynchophorus ferrugineus TaxID=354439 RepID=A0A834I0C3_RHYFE|nr:hypothetical protein GWI33_016862 [Rhynchophorus ferrugineus]